MSSSRRSHRITRILPLNKYTGLRRSSSQDKPGQATSAPQGKHIQNVNVLTKKPSVSRPHFTFSPHLHSRHPILPHPHTHSHIPTYSRVSGQLIRERFWCLFLGETTNHHPSELGEASVGKEGKPTRFAAGATIK